MDQPAAEWVDLATLRPWARNPRLNDGRPVEEVAASIRRFGFASPIIARRSDQQIIAGHTRWKAAQTLGLDKVPVRYVELDDQEAIALALADNRTSELAEWEDESLAELLRELGEATAGLGWSADELDELLRELEADEGGAPGDGASPSDDIPTEVEPLTQAGDVVQLGRHTLHCGDCLEVLRSLPDNSVDSIVTDPPYGLSPDKKARTWDDLEILRAQGKGPKGGLMGREWDAAVPGVTWARECLRVLKPGGYIIAFASTRTIHRLTCAVEDAGFEIRDQFGWMYYEGMPKGHNVTVAIDRALGAEPKVIGSRKVPLLPSHNKMVDPEARQRVAGQFKQIAITEPTTPEARAYAGWNTNLKPAKEPAVVARKPLTGTIAENILEYGTGGLNIDGCRIPYGDPAWPQADVPNDPHPIGRWPANLYRCPKPTRAEKEAGCSDLNHALVQDRRGPFDGRPGEGTVRSEKLGNIHPTVKPVKLMQWLIRLVTPPGGTVVEPFCGSGTTLLAAEAEGMTCIGAEQEPQYCDIIRARWSAHGPK